MTYVPKPKSINDLLTSGGPRLSALKVRKERRNLALEHVRAALPAELAAVVLSAGMEGGQLTVGVAHASWASRLRYQTERLRTGVSASMGVDIDRVRIRIVTLPVAGPAAP